MYRRNFIRTTGLAIAGVMLSDSLFASKQGKGSGIINMPESVSAIIGNETVDLVKSKGGTEWTYRELFVIMRDTGSSVIVDIRGPKLSLNSVKLNWVTTIAKESSILNDHWERTYGDSSWHKPFQSEILPWYFLEYNGKTTNGFGVKTGTKSFCSWAVDEKAVSLILDTRSGGNGVQLGDRTLSAAEIVVMKGKDGETPFVTARRFTRFMCDKARMPNKPVYGINDWYFTYGSTSEKLIMQHTELMAPMADGLENRPFSVIDAGWFKGPPSDPNENSWSDDMGISNEKFPDMSSLAGKIKNAGMRPGLWTRPLCGSSKDPRSLMLPSIKGRSEIRPVLDPSIPENLERVKNYFRIYKDWGYEMVKFDYSSYDFFGKWGFEMFKDSSMTPANWSTHDPSKTNAEIILSFYHAIREAAGLMYVIGCNTFSHLSAGLFELNRIGDDTSGNEWARTRKMGVNTLAFRGIHHGAFYAADADCVGLTKKVPWEKNKQWMELVAKCGTPLFISAQPEAVGADQKTAIKECFKIASQDLPLGEPLDWIETQLPKKWLLNGNTEIFNWD